MKYQLCLSLIDVPSECWIPNLDCIVWWKFVYGKIACLGEWFIIVFMTVSSEVVYYLGRRTRDVSGNDCVFAFRESAEKYWLKWQCVELVFGMCLFSTFGQGADYPDRLSVVFV